MVYGYYNWLGSFRDVELEPEPFVEKKVKSSKHPRTLIINTDVV